MRLGWLLILVLLGLTAGGQAELAPIELRDGDVVAFVGGTDMVRLQNEGRLEAGLSWEFRSARPRFRDLAWDGDTVYHQGTVHERWRKEAFGDWGAQLERVGATIVIAQFGKIESLDGVGRVGEFEAAYGKLLDVFAAGGRRVVLLAPMASGWGQVGGESFDRYTAAVRSLAEQRGMRFVSAPALARALNHGGPPQEMVEAVREKHRLWYDYWRPANWKCLFGDDANRNFGNAAEGLPSFKDEWSTFPELIAAAEANVYSGGPAPARAAPERTGSGEADIEEELAAFVVADDYEINLFADERDGIANPLSVRWDADGRMFVACSDVYPQVEPGVMPDDKIIALSDTNRDGRADRSEVFARGLNIPTGMEVGADGVYVGQNTEILLFDWDGGREALLSGFGNGDSHQTINSFVWGPAGDLWFCQGDGIESRVETPFGIASLYQAGVFRLRPRELRLDGLLDDFMGPGNPWGVAFDDFGQSFVVDGAGGISYLTPASIPVKRRLGLPRIGKPGGYCGVECIGDGEFLTGDYKKNQVSRFRVTGDGAGFGVEFLPPLLRSEHRNFRPIDVKLGPDRAIYIVDWYNPITCHQDDFYRHPDRDKTHGRIWRVSKRQAQPVETQPLTNLSEAQLVERLKSGNRWVRLKAKQQLVAKGLSAAPAEVRAWGGRDLLEAIALLEMAGIRDLPLLRRLAGDDDPRLRAYAARVAGKWGSYRLLEEAAEDPHPRVRMEAILACGQIPQPRSILIAAAAAEHPRDRWIDYALAQAVHHLKPLWLPAFLRGELDFENRRRGLAAVLGEADAPELIDQVRRVLENGVEREERITLLKTLVAVGDDESDLRQAIETVPPHADLLRALAEHVRPSFDVIGPLTNAIGASGDPEVPLAALELVRRWQVEELQPLVIAVIRRELSGGELRRAAILALGALGGEGSLDVLNGLADPEGGPEPAALTALLAIDSEEAARRTAEWFVGTGRSGFVREMLAEFAGREGALGQLAEALAAGEMDTARGEWLRAEWISTGLVDAGFSALLDRLSAVEPAGMEFSEPLVEQLVAAGARGDHERGRAVFESARVGCAACHRVGEVGGAIGPDLSAVGSGVSRERIVTELLWPGRLVKEGYSLMRVTLRDGRVQQGYEQGSRDETMLLLRDFVTRSVHEIPRDQISKSEALGSLMPAVAQNLSEQELADLCAYLFGLRG